MKTSNNTILITGGTSGIGLAFAKEFHRMGNRVIITGRRAERLNEISEEYPGIITRQSDISDEDQRVSLYNWATREFPELNVIVNNAGIQLATDLTKPLELSRVNLELETNFIAPVHLISLFTRHLCNRRDAAIINITSGLAFSPRATMPVYCASKAAMHSLSLSARHQLGPKGIKVFEIAPPAVDTELGHQHRGDKNSSHGGMHVNEFIGHAIAALKVDQYETAVGQAAIMRDQRELLFPVMNK